jgi:hypothetical protein
MGKSTTEGGGKAGVSIKGHRMLNKSLGNIHMVIFIRPLDHQITVLGSAHAFPHLPRINSTWNVTATGARGIAVQVLPPTKIDPNQNGGERLSIPLIYCGPGDSISRQLPAHLHDKEIKMSFERKSTR